METEPNPEEGASAPDNSKEEGSLDTSGFETTAERLEELIKSMEVMLLDVEQLRTTCSEQASELMHAAADLRKQQEELKESYSELSREIQEIVESMDNLFSTKSAFEPQEKQTQKLNQQL
ncbi:small subunit ribosomal protein S27 [Sarotherodon galilaeus]